MPLEHRHVGEVAPTRQACSSLSNSLAKRAVAGYIPLSKKPKLSYVGRRICQQCGWLGPPSCGCRTWQPSPTTAWAAEGMASLDTWTMPEEGLQAPSISRSNEFFLKQNIEFVWGIEGIDLAELNNIFTLVGFPSRDLGKLQIALNNTHKILWVRSTKKSRWAQEGQMLGFARASSDKALTATIWDVSVHPAWQRGGLGRGLLERLLASLIADDITTICLYAEPGVVSLYERMGFQKDPGGVKGMAFQRKSAEGKVLVAAST